MAGTGYVFNSDVESLGNDSSSSQTLTDPTDATFFVGKFDPGFNGTIIDMDYSASVSLTANDLTVPTNYAGTGTDDSTIGAVAWTDPTNAEGNTSSTNATIDLTGDFSNYAGTVVDDATVGSIAWSNPSNAVGTGTSPYAVAALPNSGDTSHYLKFDNYGFSIPTGATILGIKVETTIVETNPGVIMDNSAKIVKGGVISGDEKADGYAWGSIANVNTYGAQSDIWGLTWTAADINDSTFGFAISAKQTSTSAGATAEVWSAEIEIYYEIKGHYLKCTNFGFAIPSNATINGIRVALETSTGSILMFDNSAKIVKGGVISGDEKASATAWNISGRGYGSSTDLFGLTWTPSDINSSTFGFAISAKSSESLSSSIYGHVNTVSITIDYTIPVTVKLLINPQGLGDETFDSTILTWVAGVALSSPIFSGFKETADFTNAKLPLTAKIALTWADGEHAVTTATAINIGVAGVTE